jgi:hypothetical protein
MEPVTLILTALAFAAPEFAKGALGEAGKDAYLGLKSLIQKRFAGNEEAENALKFHETKPQAYEPLLKDALQQAGVDKDADVVKQAKALLATVDPDGAAQGKYNITVSGGQGIQVGDGNTQTNNFGAPPAAKL